MSDLSLSKFGIKQSPSFKLDLMLSPSVKNSLKGFQDKLQDQIDEVKHSPSVRRRLKHRRLRDLRKTFSVSLDIQCDYFIFFLKYKNKKIQMYSIQVFKKRITKSATDECFCSHI